MEPSELSDLLNRIANAQLAPGESLVANVEYPSVKSFFPVFDEKLPHVLLVTMDIVRAFVPLPIDPSSPPPRNGTVGDMAYTLAVFVPLASSSERPACEGYRLMASPHYSGVSLQYTAPSTGQMLAFFDRLSSAPEGVRDFTSAHYQVVPSLRSSDMVRANRHFDSSPPNIRRVPVSDELIGAFKGNGWLLYPLRQGPNGPRIVAKEGPAKVLLIGDTYSIVPLVDDPTNVPQILAARTHAKMTGQGLQFVGMPATIELSTLTFNRDTISYKATSDVLQGQGYGTAFNIYSPPGLAFLRKGFSRYDPSRAPEVTGPSN